MQPLQVKIIEIFVTIVYKKPHFFEAYVKILEIALDQTLFLR